MREVRWNREKHKIKCAGIIQRRPQGTFSHSQSCEFPYLVPEMVEEYRTVFSPDGS